jgi:hypothetical protein
VCILMSCNGCAVQRSYYFLTRVPSHSRSYALGGILRHNNAAAQSEYESEEARQAAVEEHQIDHATLVEVLEGLREVSERHQHARGTVEGMRIHAKLMSLLEDIVLYYRDGALGVLFGAHAGTAAECGDPYWCEVFFELLDVYLHTLSGPGEDGRLAREANKAARFVVGVLTQAQGGRSQCCVLQHADGQGSPHEGKLQLVMQSLNDTDRGFVSDQAMEELRVTLGRHTPPPQQQQQQQQQEKPAHPAQLGVAISDAGADDGAPVAAEEKEKGEAGLLSGWW